jgi:hypothetical protein
MNNVDKAMELAEKFAEISSEVYYMEDQGTSSEMAHEYPPLLAAQDAAFQALRTHLEAMEADRLRLLDALIEISNYFDVDGYCPDEVSQRYRVAIAQSKP